MTFDAILTQIIDLLKRQGRVSYSALKRRFDLSDDYLNDLKDELLYVHPVRDDEEGRTHLVWRCRRNTRGHLSTWSVNPTGSFTAASAYSERITFANDTSHSRS